MKEVKQWEMRMITKEQSPNTVKSYLSDIHIFFDWLKEKELKEIDIEVIKSLTIKDFDDYMTYLMTERKNSASSRARRVKAIISFFQYLCSIKVLDKNNNIIEDLAIPKQPKREKSYLTQEECTKLISIIKGKNKIKNIAIIRTFLSTGVRLQELLDMNVSSIKTMTINDVKKTYIHVIGKGNKERIVGLNEATIEAINEWLTIRPDSKDPALFLTKEGIRMKPNPVQVMIKNYLTKIGREDCSVHSLRHTFATMALKERDIVSVQNVLGHESLETTAIYTHVSKEQVIMVSDAINF